MISSSNGLDDTVDDVGESSSEVKRVEPSGGTKISSKVGDKSGG